MGLLAWKKANIVLIHKKRDAEDLKNYRRIRILSVLYKPFIKILVNHIDILN